MKPSKFWNLVGQHPWLPRILVGFWDSLEGHNHLNPEVIATFLSDSAIKTEIGFITFNPWESLVMDELPKVFRTELGRDQTSVTTLTKAKYHVCFWNVNKRFGGRCTVPFSGETSNCHDHDISVGGLLEIASSLKFDVDAIVRISERSGLRQVKGNARTFMPGGGDDEFVSYYFCYEIFLHPQRRKPVN